MKEKALTFLQGNPVHDGHVALFDATLQEAHQLDIYVSRARQRPRDLPHFIRQQAVRKAVQGQEWGDRTHLLDVEERIEGGLFSIRPELYNTLSMGSDVANLFDPENLKLQNPEAEYFLSFPSIVILQRPGHELIDRAANAIRHHVSDVIVSPPRIAISATDIRKQSRAGKDIRQYLPDGVWEIIQDDTPVFFNE